MPIVAVCSQCCEQISGFCGLCNHCKKVSNKFNKSMIYLLTSSDTEERIAQNIYIHNSNKNFKRINHNNNINQETDRHRL